MDKIEEVINKLSINEKIEFLRGINFWETKKDDRFNLNGIRMSDTTNGIRKVGLEVGLNTKAEVSTCYPTSSALACSFSRDLLKEVGIRVGKDAKAKGINVVLGPGINIKRNPLCGRNFEYFSEDPYLTGELAKNYCIGLEAEKVGATLKHFACNSTENERARINEVVDTRALHEIYLSAFKNIISNADVAAVMASYNKINGEYACENKYLLKDVLKDEYNYKGLIMSDWMGVNDSIKSLFNGLDLEMPNSGNYNFFKLLDAYNNKLISEEDINKPLRNVLNFIYKYQNIDLNTKVDYESNHAFAIKAIEESLVLLKNDDNVLPLRKDETILILGELAKNPHFQGKGSSEINPYKVDDFLFEFNKINTHYTYFKGYDNSSSINNKLINESIRLAKNKDKVVVFLGTRKEDDSEGFDCKDASLNINQIELINRLSEVNKNIIVILETGNVKELPFINNIKGLILTYLGGEGVSKGLINTLFGFNNPSGRLSETFFKKLSDHPSFNYLKNNYYDNLHSESIFVGYRYFVSFKDKVLFPFGYGLSYSNIEYQNINIDRDTLHKDESLYVYLDLINNSNIDSKEVIEIYVKKPNDLIFNPDKELINFDKAEVKSHNNYHLTLKLDYKDFAYFDIKENRFRVQKGNYKIYVSKDSLNDIKEFDIYIDGEDIISPYLDNENKLACNKYFLKDITLLSNEEFKEIDSKIVIHDINEINYDYSCSFNFAIYKGSRGAKKVKKILMSIKKIKNSEEVQAYIFGTPLRQFKLFVPGIDDPDLDLIINIFNNKSVIMNLIKFLNRLKEVSKK